jgi:8-oxo-dGTP pyrophosphatase MutT (NUDIX family)
MSQTVQDSPFTLLDTRTAWTCPWYVIRQDDLQLPDGSAGEYNVITKNDAVWVVPVLEDGQVVLIHNYRHTLGEWCWELPAGTIKDGQTPLQAAQAELHEEIGGEGGDWQLMIRAATMNGLGSEIGHFYLASGITLGDCAHESTEVMTIHCVPLPVAIAMARNGDINDAQSIMALLLAEPLLAGQFDEN